MGEGVGQEVLTANPHSKTECATLKIRPARPAYLPLRTERRTLRSVIKPAHSPRLIRTVVIRDVRELETLNSLWMALAKDAADPNIFYEPWWLLPSLRHLHAGRDVIFLLMFVRNPNCPTGSEILCGMFPFELAPRYRGLPCRVLRLLRPTYNRLCTPLVHREFVTECVGALLDWTEHNSARTPLVEFRFITGEGRVAQELHQQISERRWTAFQSECTIRALLKPMPTAELYLASALRGKHRKEFHRLEKRLSEMGPTEYRCLEPQGDAGPWIASFLELESSGWKGQNGSSLASREETRRFFEESALEAHRHRQLMMLGLFHRNKPIALKCNFFSGRGSVAFKIAFDENFERYSPGMLLEIENVRRFHDMREIAWMDSTAEAQHFMINRLWIDRRSVETLVVSPNRAWGNFIVSGFPFLRWVKGAMHLSLQESMLRKRPEKN